MADYVIKKDGTKESFDSEKIKRSIMAATQEADIAEERQSEIVEQVTATAIAMAEGKEEIATSEIKEKILSELDKMEPSVSAAWRNYEKQKGA